MNRRLHILTIIDYYLPAYKAGGPVRSVANLVAHLGDEFDFAILTSDRDFKDLEPYSDLQPGIWQRVGKARVMYLQPQEKKLLGWHRRLAGLDYDLIYLNGFFSRLSIKTILLWRLGLIPRKPIVLAPRGEFSRGALALKRLKKQIYLWVAKQMGLYKRVIWQASSKYERQNIQEIFGDNFGLFAGLPIISDFVNVLPKIYVAPNLTYVQKNSGTSSCPPKVSGSVRLVFLSRISRKKNLDWALRLLPQISGDIALDIYGPIEDPDYWHECMAIIADLPAHIKVEYRGAVSPEEVEAVFSRYHLFFFPTRGENFGHVIFESLCAGCPVLISDQTPWRNLAVQHAGWDLSLSEPEQFVMALQQLIDMDEAAFRPWSHSARECGIAFSDDPAIVAENRRLFLESVSAL